MSTIRSKRDLKRQDLSENGGSTLSQQPLLSKIIGVPGGCLSVYLAKAISDACKAKKQLINPLSGSRLTGGAQFKWTIFNTRTSQQGCAHS